MYMASRNPPCTKINRYDNRSYATILAKEFSKSYIRLHQLKPTVEKQTELVACACYYTEAQCAKHADYSTKCGTELQHRVSGTRPHA